MTDILDEILNEQSYEKKLYYFRKLLPIIIASAIIIVILMFIYNWYNNKSKTADIKNSEILINTIYNNNVQGTLEFDTLSITENSKISELAALEQVNIKLSAKDEKTAIELLEKIINHKQYDIITTYYARIIWLGLMIDKEDLDTNNKAQLEQYLADFNDVHKPFWGMGNIFKALRYIKLQEKEIAMQILQTIVSSTTTSNNIKEQAKILMSNLSY